MILRGAVQVILQYSPFLPKGSPLGPRLPEGSYEDPLDLERGDPLNILSPKGKFAMRV